MMWTDGLRPQLHKYGSQARRQWLRTAYGSEDSRCHDARTTRESSLLPASQPLVIPGAHTLPGTIQQERDPALHVARESRQELRCRVIPSGLKLVGMPLGAVSWVQAREGAVPGSVAVRGVGACQSSCDPAKVTRPELRIERGILRTHARELHPHICAVTRRGERDLNECRCGRRGVGSLTVPSKQHAVRGIYFDEAAGNCRPVEVEAERLPHSRSDHQGPFILTRPVPCIIQAP